MCAVDGGGVTGRQLTNSTDAITLTDKTVNDNNGFTGFTRGL